jgi:hypothetical protein
MSLSNYGVLLSELGRATDALPPTQEATTVYRRLAAEQADARRPDLAWSWPTSAGGSPTSTATRRP